MTAPPARADLAHALNRISSALYLLAVPLRRRAVRGQPPAARPGARLEAAARDEGVIAGAVAREAGAPRRGCTTTRSPPPTRRVSRRCCCGTCRPTARRARRRDRLRDRPPHARAGPALRRQAAASPAFDEAEAFVSEARAKMDGVADLRAPITLRVAEPHALPADDESADVAVSNLAVAGAADPGAAAEEMARVLAPGGTAVITAPLRGTWAEFLDLFRDVLRESGKRDQAWPRSIATSPACPTAAPA